MAGLFQEMVCEWAGNCQKEVHIEPPRMGLSVTTFLCVFAGKPTRYSNWKAPQERATKKPLFGYALSFYIC